MKRFFFSTAFKIKDWNVRTALLLQWRNITRRYPQFEALVFDENNFYSDQVSIIYYEINKNYACKNTENT